MSIYTYPDTSPIKEIVFHYANDRAPVALLTSDETSEHLKLHTMREAMCAIGWTCIPAWVNGKEVLQVGGFDKEYQLINFMQRNSFSDGTPLLTPEPGDHPTRTTGEWIQDSGLKIGGLLNLLGDVSLLVTGVMNKDKNEIAAGALYTAGASVLTRYGNVKTERQVREVSEKTAAFLKRQAVDLPDSCSLSHIARQAREGLIPTAENFLYRYPSEVMLGAYTLGAATMLQSGIKRGNPWKIGYGATSVALKATSLVIKEKHKTEEEKLASANQGPVGQLVDWIQEKPLRLYGFGSMVSDILLGLSAFRDYKTNPKQRSYIFEFITTGSYVLADLLIALSHKNPANANSRFDADEQRSIMAMVAEAISRQPKAMQAALVHNVAGFLTTQPEVNGSPLDIANAINEQLKHVNKNPWTHRSETNILSPNLTSNR